MSWKYLSTNLLSIFISGVLCYEEDIALLSDGHKALTEQIKQKLQDSSLVTGNYEFIGKFQEEESAREWKFCLLTLTKICLARKPEHSTA